MLRESVRIIRIDMTEEPWKYSYLHCLVRPERMLVSAYGLFNLHLKAVNIVVDKA